MIVFITAFDEVTKGNMAVILPILQESTTQIINNQAIKDNLILTLQSLPHIPLFVATHGKPFYFEDNNGNPALEKEEIGLLSHRKIYVFACWTANELGQTQWAETTYYGYTGGVSAPDADDDRLIEIQKPIFEYILHNFFLCNTETEIYTFVENLKRKVDEALDDLFELWENDVEIDTSSTDAFLNDVWKKLRVYHLNNPEPIRHEQGFETDIFYEG